MKAVPAIGQNRYFPVRLMICPEPMDTSSRPAISGSSCTPDRVGETPRTTWKKAGR